MINKKIKKDNPAFTLIEILSVMFIMLLLFSGILTVFSSTLKANTSLNNDLTAQMEVRHSFNTMVANLRSASPSGIGDYAIAAASSTGLIYYSDIDSDGVMERVHYFLSGATLKVGLIEPSGNPLSYNTANEKVSDLIHNVANGGAAIFSYYNGNYSGGSSSPLTYPLNISAIRLIKVDVLIDKDPANMPAPIEFTTQVSIRGLKDNL
jgi:type II secretory pathway pseudopilin PulG